MHPLPPQLKHFPSALRRWLACLLLTVWAGTAWADNASGVWTSSTGDYLAVLESSSPANVVVLQVDAAFSSGKVYVGSRSGAVLNGVTPDGASALALTMEGTRFSGTQTNAGVTRAINGTLMLAYGAGPYDGIWQRAGSSDRYLALLSLTLQQLPLTLLVDVKLAGSTPAYDISTGTVTASGGGTTLATYVGRSLTSGYTISLAFKGGTPPAATYSALSTARPPGVTEQFNTTQLLGLGSTTNTARAPHSLD